MIKATKHSPRRFKTKTFKRRYKPALSEWGL